MRRAHALRLLLLSSAATAAFVFACKGGTGSVTDDGGSEGGSSSGTGGSSGSSGSSGNPGPYDTCSVASDCAWGEIDREIVTAADCPCLFGCPHLALGAETVKRRQDQYKALCTPGKNGKGQTCPIDDCAQPPPLACNGGKCGARDASAE
jgi:hypothetical protein